MKVSPDYKRFKRINFVGDTFTLPSKRSSIICTIEGYHRYPNTDDLKRLEKEPQNRGIQNQKTVRIITVYDRALCLALSYADTVIITGHTVRPDVSTSHGLITDHPYNQVNTKPNLHLIIEMIPFLVYYSYATKYHKLSSMFVPGYQCSNIYIDIEKGTLLNKDIQ